MLVEQGVQPVDGRRSVHGRLALPRHFRLAPCSSKVLKGRRACRQFANVPSKSHVRCVPSQKGLLLERPHRHIANWAGWEISRPSGALRWTGPETRYGPFSLGVMVTSSMRKSSESPFELVDLDRSGHRQPTNADTCQCENRIGQRWRNRRDADLTNTRR